MPQIQTFTPTRAERRIPLKLRVRVEGDDAKGTHFCHDATTLEISRNGARLASLQPPLPVNSVVDVQYGGVRTRCRVVWLGKTPEERGQIGIRCLDESRVPWSHLLSDANAVATPVQEPAASSPAGDGWPERERRQAPRYSCNILATIRQGDSFTTSARLTDVSLTGGYLEAMSPLPVGTEVKVVLETGTAKIPLTAVVRTLHPAMGNGVAFTKIDVEALDLLQGFLASLGGSPAANAAVPAEATRATLASCENGPRLDRQIEALVQLLEEKAILKREDLVRLLQDSGKSES